MTRPFHIGLIMKGSREWAGGIEYIKNLVLALGSLPQAVRSTFQVSLICNRTLDERLYRDMIPHLHQMFYEDEGLGTQKILDRIRWRIMESLFDQRDKWYDDFLEKTGIDFAYPYCTTGKTSFRSTAWLYDFQHMAARDFFSDQEIEDRNQFFSFVARHAPVIIVSSEAARSDLKRFFPEALEKTKVLSFRAYPDPSWYEPDPAEVQKRYGLPDHFFSVSNQFWQHKNHLVLFQALNYLKSRSVFPVLVCTGHLYDPRRPGYSDTVLQTIHTLGIARQVYLLGLIPRSDQVQLLRRSLAVIQPSLFEGWSTVVEEARCLSKPVILSDIPVHREQNPPEGLFFEPRSFEVLADLLAQGWERLSPGPFPEEEAKARARALSDVQDFGYNFLTLAKGE
jgi:glycosyltransferase involved in cell wall biosynthesis